MKLMVAMWILFFHLSLLAMQNSSAWHKLDDGFTYICQNEPLQGSIILIRVQDHFEQNRYCEIILDDFKTHLSQQQWDEIERPIKKACNEIKTGLYSPGIGIDRCAFWFRAGSDQAIKFLNFLEGIHIISPFNNQQWTEITTLLKG